MIPDKNVGYTCKELAAAFGGNWRDATPHRGGMVTHLRCQPKYNPRIEQGYFETDGPYCYRYARALVERGEPVPVFVQRPDRRWYFIGYWRPVVHYTHGPLLEDCRKLGAVPGRVPDSLVILQPVA